MSPGEMRVLLLILGSLTADSALGDPCVTYTVLDQPWRSTDCSGIECTSQWMDDGDLMVGWYRFNSSGGRKIPETVVPVSHCSGSYPGWLNGAHPSVGEGEVTRTVCFTGYSSTCYGNREIRVKNCSGYFVYQLKPTFCCSSVYCTDPENSTRKQAKGSATGDPTQEPSSVPSGDTSSDRQNSGVEGHTRSSTRESPQAPPSAPVGDTTSAADSALGDPCVTHTVLDQPWRSTDCSNNECIHGWWSDSNLAEILQTRRIPQGKRPKDQQLETPPRNRPLSHRETRPQIGRLPEVKDTRGHQQESPPRDRPLPQWGRHPQTRRIPQGNRPQDQQLETPPGNRPLSHRETRPQIARLPEVKETQGHQRESPPRYCPLPQGRRPSAPGDVW
ncbi:uncharacterized protein LOC127580612 isoform X2 [Pristis pectinata]|uniref:uncharacterized protein LOC127580612 isoform X2 n=1 Tax=Pristis pectinata TaxID=685728 RepID=UPI00223C9BCE|nr:uncharacterized protein LOC127580612 isoform X2 [Pristis pectinata]